LKSNFSTATTGDLKLKMARRRLTTYLRQKFGVSVFLQDMVLTNWSEDVGEFQGNAISVNPAARNVRDSIFVICHLFGHMIQFSEFDKYRNLVEAVDRPKPLKLRLAFKRRFAQYELEAYCYGRELMRRSLGEPFAATMDEAYHLYFRTDLELFFRYVASGRRNTVQAFSHAIRAKNRARKATGERPISNKVLPRSIMPVRGAVVV
jgi:hypothetical protein